MTSTLGGMGRTDTSDPPRIRRGDGHGKAASARPAAHPLRLGVPSAARGPAIMDVIEHDQIELLPIPVYVCDIRGIIVDYNTRAADIWGRAPKPGDANELYCGFVRRFRQDGSVLPRDNAPMAHALVTGQRVRDVELTVERPDRSRRTILVNVRIVRDERHRIVGAVNCFHDITEWKDMADALNHTAMLGALRRIAGEMAHTCSNVLASVSSSLNMAAKGATDPNALRLLAGASRSAERGVDYARRLLAFARAPQVEWDTSDLDAVLQRYGLTEAPAMAEAVEGPVAAAEGGRSVLLVDDDAALRAVARDALSSLGLDVVDAGAGEAALDIVRSGRAFRLMVMDVGMAPMNGLELIRRVRALRPDLKVLIMTGDPDSPDSLAEDHDGMVVLRKPFGIGELASCIERLAG